VARGRLSIDETAPAAGEKRSRYRDVGPGPTSRNSAPQNDRVTNLARAAAGSDPFAQNTRIGSSI
jgi:hypothetical protein